MIAGMRSPSGSLYSTSLRILPGQATLESFHFMRKQLRRWSHGFVQNRPVAQSRLLKTCGVELQPPS